MCGPLLFLQSCLPVAKSLLGISYISYLAPYSRPVAWLPHPLEPDTVRSDHARRGDQPLRPADRPCTRALQRFWSSAAVHKSDDSWPGRLRTAAKRVLCAIEEPAKHMCKRGAVSLEICEHCECLCVHVIIPKLYQALFYLRLGVANNYRG